MCDDLSARAHPASWRTGQQQLGQPLISFIGPSFAAAVYASSGLQLSSGALLGLGLPTAV